MKSLNSKYLDLKIKLPSFLDCYEYEIRKNLGKKIIRGKAELNLLIDNDKSTGEKVLNKKISANIRVTMIHGQRDEVVPTIYSNYVLNIFRQAKKKKVIIKNGDHSLSNQRSLKRIIKELEIIIKDIF